MLLPMTETTKVCKAGMGFSRISLAIMALRTPVFSTGGMKNLLATYSAEPAVAVTVAPVMKLRSCRRDRDGLSIGRLVSMHEGCLRCW